MLSWCGDEDVVGQGDKVLIYLLASMFLPTFDIRFSLHSDRAEGKSSPYLQTAAHRAAPLRYQYRRCDHQPLVCIETSHLGWRLPTMVSRKKAIGSISITSKEDCNLQTAQWPLPQPWVGLNATHPPREMICELRTGELPRRKTSPGLGLKLVWW